MSGWIRVKELPTRYEVRSPYADEALPSRAEAKRKLEEARLLTPSLPFKLATIRRHQVKRTEVEAQRTMLTTYYDDKMGYVARVFRTRELWGMIPESAIFKESVSVYPTREEAESAARAWLDAKGYRIRKVAT